jgi:hypothetical protein
MHRPPHRTAAIALLVIVSGLLSGADPRGQAPEPAVTDAARDEAAELQARIDAAYRSGSGLVDLAPGVHRIARSLRMRSGVTLRGVRPCTGRKSGTWLRWAGQGDGPMLDYEACQDCTMTGVGLDGGGTTVTAIRIRSVNQPSSWGLVFREFAIVEAGTGVAWGEGDFPEGQADHVVLEDFAIWNITGFGIVVDSWNSGDYSEIRRGQFNNCVKGHIDLRKSGFLTIASCAAGGASPSPFLSTHGQGCNLLVQNCQCEGQAYFLKAGGADDAGHITLQSCTINDPVRIEGITRVLGLGNFITAEVALDHPGAVWFGLEDRILAAMGGKVTGPGTFVNQRAKFATPEDGGAGRGERILGP